MHLNNAGTKFSSLALLVQPRASSMLPPGSGDNAVDTELVAVQRWAMFSQLVTPNPDSRAATFMQPLLLPGHGIMYISTWDGAILDVLMETGELRQTTPWFANGQAAHLMATNTRCAPHGYMQALSSSLLQRRSHAMRRIWIAVGAGKCFKQQLAAY